MKIHPRKKGGILQFSAHISVGTERLDGANCHLVRGIGLDRPMATFCYMGTQLGLPPQKRGTAAQQPPLFSPCLLWPKSWMDQDAGLVHIVLHEHAAAPPPKKNITAPTFRPMPVVARQTAGWIRMQLGTEVGLGPSDVVLDGDPASQRHGKGYSSGH